MSKRYRPWKIDEPMLLPATVQEFVEKNHLAKFVLNLVVEEIDLEEVERVYRVDRGQPPFDPAMMTALPLYAAIATGCTRRGGSPRPAGNASTS